MIDIANPEFDAEKLFRDFIDSKYGGSSFTYANIAGWHADAAWTNRRIFVSNKYYNGLTKPFQDSDVSDFHNEVSTIIKIWMRAGLVVSHPFSINRYILTSA